jgi:NitT/TauT family transport system permease protein
MRRLMNVRPDTTVKVVLVLLPFALALGLYLVAAAERHAINPTDKLLPLPGAMLDAIQRYAFQADPRTGKLLLWTDTAASLSRLGLGLLISTLIGLTVGIGIGVIPLIRATLRPFVAVLSMIPPLAVLPVLFIVMGLGEASKVALIVIGIAPFLVRDLSMHLLALPEEMRVKAQSLGASTWQFVVRVTLPQAMPRLIDALRLSLGPAFLFLISAEAIAAEDGLGYRIFLVRRFLAMDVILPYVAWITCLAFLSDWLLHRLSRRAFAWAHVSEDRP